MKKEIIYITLLFVLLDIQSVLAIDIIATPANPFEINFGDHYINITGNISTNYTGNLTIDSNGLNFSLNGTYVLFNSTSNLNISSLSFNNVSDKLFFTASASSSTLSVTSKMNKSNTNYVLKTDNIAIDFIVSSANGIVNFNYSGWSEHAFEISELSSSTWWNTGYLSATFLPNSSSIGIISVNVSNSSGTNNATHIFFDNKTTTNFSDLRVVLNNITIQPYWFDNDTSQWNTITLWINKTAAGIIGIYHNNMSVTSSTKNISAVFPYADGDDYARNWLYTYTQCGGGSQSWTTQANGTRIQSNTGLSANKCNYVINTLLTGNYQVTSKIRIKSIWDTNTASAGVMLGSDGAWDYAAVPWQTSITQNALLQDNNVFGAAANNYQTLTSDIWFMVDGWTSASSQRGRIYYVNQNETSWQSVSSWNPTVNRRIGIYSSRTTAVEFDYWYAWEGTKLNLGSWSADADLFVGYNNYTNDNSIEFLVLTTKTVNFSVNYSTNLNANHFNWSVNGTNQNRNFSYFNYNIPTGNTIITNTLYNNANEIYTFTWVVTGEHYNFELLSPANMSTEVSYNPVTLIWREWTTSIPHTYQIATDYQFLNIISSGTATSTTENFSVSLTLNANTKYYWRAKNNGGSYSNFFEFTTTSPTTINGTLNITAFSEQVWDRRLMEFYAQVYNSTSVLNKSTITGWVNFTQYEVSSGEYLVRIVPNSSYASRSVLATSPTNVTLWLPPTTVTINTIAFYLLDYTTLYPWSSSILTVSKNNSVMHSSYFDADAKVAVYLIQGDSYGISIINGNNIQNWGNYIAISSGNVEIVITDISVNATSTQPFNYNLSYSTNDITLSWTSNVTINSLNYTILKNNSILDHQLITSVLNGQSADILTDTNSMYYVYITVNTSQGTYRKVEVIDFRGGQLRSDCGLGLGCMFGFGSGNTRFEFPQWGYNIGSIFLVWVLAGSFGALFAALGAVITVVLILLFMWWGWLNTGGATIGFIGAVAILIIIDYLRNRE